MSVIINGSAGVTTNSGAVYDGIQRGTAQTAPFTDNTRAEFTSIPSWVRRITVTFSNVGTNGTANLLIQIGSGSIVTSGYQSAAMTSGTGLAQSVNTATATSGFILSGSFASTYVVNGSAILTLSTGNTWVCSSTLGNSNAANALFGGGSSVTAISSALDRVRITTTGSDTFDTGSVINILYE
jgi:hypothetical protein